MNNTNVFNGSLITRKCNLSELQEIGSNYVKIKTNK